MTADLLTALEALLATDSTLVADGRLLKNAVAERADRLDPALLTLLLSDARVKAHFFTDVGPALVFDKVRFRDFVSNKAFLPDSYTKLIYIDPPYNTGNDGFRYNDRFNHSSWLTFMKNRLEIARELLHSTGSIYINIDYNEFVILKY